MRHKLLLDNKYGVRKHAYREDLYDFRARRVDIRLTRIAASTHTKTPSAHDTTIIPMVWIMSVFL